MGFRLPKICSPKCWPKVSSPEARVTMMPAETEIRSEGSWLAKPSPTVRSV